MNKEANIFSITSCDISDIVTEINRFMFHIILIHMITCSLDTKEIFLGKQLFKTLFVTALAVMIYHIIFKKIINGKLKKIQSYCGDPNSINTKRHKNEQNNQ